MNVRLAYWKNGMQIELNDDYNVEIVEPIFLTQIQLGMINSRHKFRYKFN